MTDTNQFAVRFKQKLLDVHWRQWRALGVTYRVPPETHWILDLEALFVSSLALCIYDHQLLTACIEWLARNREWINVSRLKCIIKTFTTPIAETFGPLLPPFVVNLLEHTLNQYGFPLKLGAHKTNTKHADLRTSYEEVFRTYTMQDIVSKLTKIQSSVLLQLSLRASYGSHARTETFLYLLLEKQGAARTIADEICYSEKTVHKVLEKWKTSGFVKKVQDDYIVTTPSWHDFWTYGENQGYMNWTRLFRMLDQLQMLFTVPPWRDDSDAQALAFRVLAKHAEQVAAPLNVRMPDVKIHPAEEYYSLFTTGLQQLLDRILNPST